jgi:L-alanine-DL-glutamate epimerase-like enolase superfamily enzyme
MWRKMYQQTLLLNNDGTLSPPDRPGLGVELNDAALAPYRVE